MAIKATLYSLKVSKAVENILYSVIQGHKNTIRACKLSRTWKTVFSNVQRTGATTAKWKIIYNSPDTKRFFLAIFIVIP